MKVLIVKIICLLCFATIMAQPQKKPKVLVDKVVAVVGDRAILKSDIDNAIIDIKRRGAEIPENAECLMLEQNMSIKALMLQAEKDSIKIGDDEIDSEIEQRLEQLLREYGSIEELEKAAGKSLFQMKVEFKNPIRDKLLAQRMRSQIVENVHITPSEAKVYWDKIPKDSLPFYEAEYEIGQIIVRPKPSRDAEEFAKEQLLEWKKQIENGTKDFCYLVRNYSDDPGSRASCGRYEINRNDRNYDGQWVSKAFTLKEGQISSPFKTQFGYHIIQMESRRGDEAKVRHILKTASILESDLKAAFNRLDSCRAKLIAGTIDFGKAVEEYSDDEYKKFNAGMLMGQSGGGVTIDQMDKDLVSIISTLKVGEFSKPQEYEDERGRKSIRIVYLKNKTEAHVENFKDDFNKIYQRALEDKKNDYLEKWFSRRVNGYHVVIDKDYTNCANIQYWLKSAKVLQ